MHQSSRNLAEQRAHTGHGQVTDLHRMTGRHAIRRARVRSALDAVRGKPLSDCEFGDLWLGMSRDNGHKLSHLLIKYNAERAVHYQRWESAPADWAGPLHLVSGLADPVSGGHVLELAVKTLPRAAVTELPGVGHYPSSEAPQAVAAAVRDTR